jgi:3-hydroxyacyl-[acyl-carrier-protein] dehydratase
VSSDGPKARSVFDMNKLKDAIILSAKGPAQEGASGTFVRTFSFAPDFIGFAGHFPGFPVLPAFVQVMTVITMAEEVRGRGIELVSLVKAKFRTVIRPDTDIEVQFRERTMAGGAGLEATLRVAGEIAAFFLLTFAEKSEKMP